MVLILGAALITPMNGVGGGATSISLDVVFVLDQSGSMRQNDPQRLVIQAATDFVGALGPNDAAGLVVFGGQAKAAHALSLLSAPEKRKGLLDAIAGIRYGDPRTNMAAGIERGAYELKQHGRPANSAALVFLTDGIMDTGSQAKDAEMREWLRSRLLPEARERGVRIFSIALTEDADFALIQEAASVTGGDYYRAINAKEIAGIFDRIHSKLRQSPPPPTASSTALPTPGAQAPPASILAAAWLWVAVGAGVAILLMAGIIMARRLSLAGPPLSPRGAGAGVPPTIPRVPPADVRVPPASLRDLRTGKSVQLSKPVTRIGRAPDNDMVIAEPQVSAHHAEIEYRQSHFYLRDLRSTNGTWVNTERIQAEVMLKYGDVARFDQFSYSFSGPDVGSAGTMIRDLHGGTVVSGAVRPQPAPSALVGTALGDVGATVDDSSGLKRCPAHSSFEATERCERCGQMWCALCNPPVPGERVCKRCREAEAPPKRPATGPGGSARPKAAK
jgi:hypothetical protein